MPKQTEEPNILDKLNAAIVKEAKKDIRRAGNGQRAKQRRGRTQINAKKKRGAK